MISLIKLNNRYNLYKRGTSVTRSRPGNRHIHAPLWRTDGDTSVAGGDSCTCYASCCYSSALPSSHGFYSYYNGFYSRFTLMKPGLCLEQQHSAFHKRDTSVTKRSPGMKNKKWSQ